MKAFNLMKLDCKILLKKYQIAQLNKQLKVLKANVEVYEAALKEVECHSLYDHRKEGVDPEVRINEYFVYHDYLSAAKDNFINLMDYEDALAKQIVFTQLLKDLIIDKIELLKS